ncbi:MAG: 2-C-methyl-D-erythritol 2,4-cyclodiphosphate synthase [Oscillospiraceae bacterium]
MRIGYGYDVHRYKDGRPCVLCGVTVPCTFGPDGHSDADVAIHALMDALLGAAAMGDIGRLFPDTDPKYEGIASTKLLETVMAFIREKGYELGNADITIVAQKPKISGYMLEMTAVLSEVMDVMPERLNVKATTEEGLGFTGALEGIAAHAVVILE